MHTGVALVPMLETRSLFSHATGIQLRMAPCSVKELIAWVVCFQPFKTNLQTFTVEEIITSFNCECLTH